MPNGHDDLQIHPQQQHQHQHQHQHHRIFRAEELPRWRALLAVAGFAAALLSAGGMLEYGSGSPETRGAVVATYWAVFFAFNTLAFGGAALIAGFPALSRRAVKLGWLAALLALYAWAFAVWYQHQPAGALSAWPARSAGYLPAALVVLIGLLLRDGSRLDR